ncbi:MAG: HEAT repeat domain-containing protein [Aquabacterium sp.]
MGLKKSTESAGLHQVEVRAYPRDLQGLTAQLADADPGVRRWAARDLSAEPQAAPWLCARLPQESDASVRAVLFTSLSQMGHHPGTGEAVVRGTLPLLRSEDAGLRNGAIELLAGLPDAVAPHIEALLSDADSDVRIFSVNLMGNLPHPRVPAWLAQVLMQDEAVNVVAAALEVIAEVGGQESVSAVEAAQRRFNHEPFIEFAAQLALERMASA